MKIDPNFVLDKLSRRDFLHLAGLGLLGISLPKPASGPNQAGAGFMLGRVAFEAVDVYNAPSFGARKIGSLRQDVVFELGQAHLGDAQPEFNPLWYECERVGFIHSAGIQPVNYLPNSPEVFVSPGGRLFEITIPFVDVYSRSFGRGERVYRYRYGSTHWVNASQQDAQGRWWYRISDDLRPLEYYARAEAFRLIEDHELATISPDIPLHEKRIEVDLAQQIVSCFEAGEEVFATRVSSGDTKDNGAWLTPEGSFLTYRKRPSRHMAGSGGEEPYDLPGVPWVTYFNERGVGFHGAYWHNEFGKPRSHGCLNMMPEDAKWLYCWTLPRVPDRMTSAISYLATQVYVFGRNRRRPS